MRKVFQAETRNKSGFAAGLLGGLAISLLLFLILPFTQKLTGSNPKNLLLKVDVTPTTTATPRPLHRRKRRRKMTSRNWSRSSSCFP